MTIFEEEHQRYLAPLTPAQRAKVEADFEYQSALRLKDIIKLGEIVTATTFGNAVTKHQRKSLKQSQKIRKLANEILGPPSDQKQR